MIKKIVLPLLINISIASSTQAVVILVHGSFASQSSWHKPSGKFYETLKKSGKALNKKTISFTWSGKPTYKKICHAGKNLAEYIKSYPSSEEVILIGHSHGGNVIAQATQYLEKNNKENKETLQTLTLTSLYQPPTKPLCSSPLYSLTKLLQNKAKIVDKIYLLGTPIDTTRYPINFSCVQQLYNFFSSGDFIQSVAGNYAKEYPKKKENCITNLKITLEKSGYFASEHPTHTQLHHHEIAKWLLFIPEQLKACKIGDFHRFKNGQDGEIALKNNTFPLYKTKKRSQNCDLKLFQELDQSLPADQSFASERSIALNLKDELSLAHHTGHVQALHELP